jgi:hypothetical protein
MPMQGLHRSRPRWHGLLFGVLLVGSAAVPEPAFARVSCSSDQSCVVDGVSNAALGDATLSVSDAGNLLVGNIGTSGKDGVSQVALPAGTGEVVTMFACPNFAQSEVGDQEIVTFHADVPGGIFYTMTVTNIGNDTMEMRPDFSPVGATLYTITVLDKGVVNRVFRDLPSATFSTVQGDQEEIN